MGWLGDRKHEIFLVRPNRTKKKKGQSGDSEKHCGSNGWACSGHCPMHMCPDYANFRSAPTFVVIGLVFVFQGVYSCLCETRFEALFSFHALFLSVFESSLWFSIFFNILQPRSLLLLFFEMWKKTQFKFQQYWPELDSIEWQHHNVVGFCIQCHWLLGNQDRSLIQANTLRDRSCLLYKKKKKMQTRRQWKVHRKMPVGIFASQVQK